MSGLWLFGIWAGLTIGNVAYQWFGPGLWTVAAKRSFFQGTALLTVGILAALGSLNLTDGSPR